jgi:hypothetical protein
MTNPLDTAAVYKALALRNTAELVDLNDYAVNTVRAFCRERGYSAAALATEEQTRFYGSSMDLETYLRCSRAGSKMRCTRAARRALWVASYTREALERIFAA